MASEVQLELYRVLRESQSKYTYFILAAAGTAIGFSLTQTNNAEISCYQVPLAMAVFFWGLSFFLGCKNLAYVNSTLFANSEMLRIESGQHPEVGNHPQIVQAASEGIRNAIYSNSETANKLGHWQFRTLLIGAVFYIAWHILEMWLRT